jgi:hypothetical protein
MKILKLWVSRYSVLAVLWMFLSATTYAQSSTRCTTTPDGAGASYTNCTTTTQPTDGSSQTQTQTNCTKTYDGSGGSFKNCTSNTTTTAPPAGGRLTGIAEVAAAYSAAHPRPVSPTSPASQSVLSITEASCPEAAKAYFDKGVKEGRMGGSYDVHFTKGACLIRVVYRSNIDMSYTEALSKVVTDATVAVFASGVLMPATTALSTPMGKPVCTVITHKGKKQCDGLDKFHELVKKEYKF